MRAIEHYVSRSEKAYVIADNKLALNAGWDETILAEELQELSQLDVDFDVDITGFTITEIDTLIEALSIEDQGAPREDILPAAANGPATCKTGDIWLLGKAPSLLRRCPLGRGGARVDGWQNRPDGVYRPALQRTNCRSCFWSGKSSPSGIRDGVG